MHKTKSGFTIVELLIVIVVIAIIATIGIASYSAVIHRTRSAQTVAAANQWIKTLATFKARTGGYPTDNGCLGAGYKYGVNSNSASGPQCSQTSTLSVATNAELTGTSATPGKVTLKKFAEGEPVPAFVTASDSSTVWQRGITYYTSGSNARLDVVFDKSLATAACPKLGDYTATSAKTYANGNSACTYTLGAVAGY